MCEELIGQRAQGTPPFCRWENRYSGPASWNGGRQRAWYKYNRSVEFSYLTGSRVKGHRPGWRGRPWNKLWTLLIQQFDDVTRLNAAMMDQRP